MCLETQLNLKNDPLKISIFFRYLISSIKKIIHCFLSKKDRILCISKKYGRDKHFFTELIQNKYKIITKTLILYKYKIRICFIFVTYSYYLVL